MARSRNGLTRSIKRNSGSYWRPSPSRLMSALNRRVRSTGSPIVLAQDRRYSAQQHPDLEILQLHVGVVEREFAEIGGEPGLVHNVIAAPVEQHLQHRLLVVAREPR